MMLASIRVDMDCFWLRRDLGGHPCERCPVRVDTVSRAGRVYVVHDLGGAWVWPHELRSHPHPF